ncbi:histidinol-phosphate transaminase [Putridiphycobacter roseus]|uniref:Histidinol-phosphate aminotransferase n=1 Tax=Putridiphycobacter roseus TaxID=2219161 RepID=A0A2W1ND39_9FLAO|nr:histidinol-phosphate transaminase [Putridiphycobacter roseus]PZE15986.1 histidinol-phosphate transaminase [Putridiphycobacter roseus]
MKKISKLVRPNILNLTPYSCARDEFNGEDAIFLDANESPFGNLNRYPDPYQNELKKHLSLSQSIPENNIFIGNGSDEIIDLIFRIFCRPGLDKVISFTPTYGMYEVSANINDVAYIKIPLDEQFQIPRSALEAFYTDSKVKIIFICSPNNPTGNLMDQKVIASICSNFQGIVVIDEAYIDFCGQASWNKSIADYSNLIVLQTLSKAWGAAAIRLGVAYTNDFINSLLNKVKPPYNVSQLNQDKALEVLKNKSVYEKNILWIQQEKSKLISALNQLQIVEKIFPSETNFILVKVNHAEAIYHYLLANGVVVRNRDKIMANSIRVSVGNAKENNALISALKKYEI